jgi:hypothetical protein
MCEKSGLTSSTTTTTNRINTFILPGHFISFGSSAEDDVANLGDVFHP